MTSMVRFRAAGAEYAVSVADTRQVRSAAGITPMPTPAAGVLGLLPVDDEALTITNLLGTAGEHVLVLDAGNGAFGLLVEEVLGVFIVDLNALGPAPTGQSEELVSGSMLGPDGLLLVLDAGAVARMLGR